MRRWVYERCGWGVKGRVGDNGGGDGSLMGWCSREITLEMYHTSTNRSCELGEGGYRMVFKSSKRGKPGVWERYSRNGGGVITVVG